MYYSSILGEAYNHLWDYEVVELFFLSSTTGLYLEVEFGPHGQHLGLLLNKRKEGDITIANAQRVTFILLKKIGTHYFSGS